MVFINPERQGKYGVGNNKGKDGHFNRRSKYFKIWCRFLEYKPHVQSDKKRNEYHLGKTPEDIQDIV